MTRTRCSGPLSATNARRRRPPGAVGYWRQSRCGSAREPIPLRGWEYEVDLRQVVTVQEQVVRVDGGANLLVAGTRERGQRRDGERACRLAVAHVEGPRRVDVNRLLLGDALHRVAASGEALRRRADRAREAEVRRRRRVSKPGRLPRDREAVGRRSDIGTHHVVRAGGDRRRRERERGDRQHADQWQEQTLHAAPLSWRTPSWRTPRSR